jgi:hypothetical protein
VPKLGPLGSVRGAVSDDGPYRDPILQINFPVIPCSVKYFPC